MIGIIPKVNGFFSFLENIIKNFDFLPLWLPLNFIEKNSDCIGERRKGSISSIVNWNWPFIHSSSLSFSLSLSLSLPLSLSVTYTHRHTHPCTHPHSLLNRSKWHKVRLLHEQTLSAGNFIHSFTNCVNLKKNNFFFFHHEDECFQQLLDTFHAYGTTQAPKSWTEQRERI